MATTRKLLDEWIDSAEGNLADPSMIHGIVEVGDTLLGPAIAILGLDATNADLIELTRLILDRESVQRQRGSDGARDRA